MLDLTVSVAAGSQSRFDLVKAAVAKLTSGEYLELVKAVYKRAFTVEAWRSTSSTVSVAEGAPKQPDAGFTTMCRMLQQIQLCITVRKAIRMQDIGHLRRIVDYLIPMFLGAGQSNYSREIIYLRWLLCDNASDPKLQRAILSTGVTN